MAGWKVLAGPGCLEGPGASTGTSGHAQVKVGHTHKGDGEAVGGEAGAGLRGGGDEDHPGGAAPAEPRKNM